MPIQTTVTNLGPDRFIPYILPNGVYLLTGQSYVIGGVIDTSIFLADAPELYTLMLDELSDGLVSITYTIAGSTGPTGAASLITGPTGAFGTGPTGYGNTGPTGAGRTGPTGASRTGPTGPVVTGPTGFGNTGATGPGGTGPTGAVVTGPTGAGTTGSSGTGPTGPSGNGPTGPVATGPTGPGSPGGSGPTGSVVTGPTGSGGTGATGAASGNRSNRNGWYRSDGRGKSCDRTYGIGFYRSYWHSEFRNRSYRVDGTDWCRFDRSYRRGQSYNWTDRAHEHRTHGRRIRWRDGIDRSNRLGRYRTHWVWFHGRYRRQQSYFRSHGRGADRSDGCHCYRSDGRRQSYHWTDRAHDNWRSSDRADRVHRSYRRCRDHYRSYGDKLHNQRSDGGDWTHGS